MKKYNKGFTLVELIAVIVVLAVVSLLSFISLTRTLKDSQIKEEESYKEALKTAAQLYIETNLNDYPALENVGGNIQITINSLIEKGYIKKDVKNPTSCLVNDTFILAVKQTNKTIKYTVYCNGETVVITTE